VCVCNNDTVVRRRRCGGRFCCLLVAVSGDRDELN